MLCPQNAVLESGGAVADLLHRRFNHDEDAMELHCGGHLAVWLGAIVPRSTAEHRELRDAGHLLVRDPRTGWPLFWPWVLSPTQKLANDVFGRTEKVARKRDK